MTIAPSDAAVAARSFPRRWRGLFARAAGDDDSLDLLQRSGAADLAAEAATVLADTADHLRVAAALQPPSVAPDPLDRLQANAIRLAEAIDAVGTDDWAGGPIEALTGGIDQAAALLRQAEHAIDEARSHR